MTSDPENLSALGLENYVPYLMNRIMGRYNSALSTEISALGLSTPKLRALAVLSVQDDLLIRELAVYAVIEQSTLSRALDGLEQDGLVQRAPDKSDGRAFRIKLTPAGHGAHARLWPHMMQASEAMFTGISKAEREALTVTLQKMLRNIRKHDF